MKREVTALRRDLELMQRHKQWGPEWIYREMYYQGKIRRQAEAIRKIQKVGWQPEHIIREVPYPDDEHLWDEPPHHSQRRPKRRPMVVIDGY